VSVTGRRARKLEFLPVAPGAGSTASFDGPRPENADAATVVRVFGSMRRLRGDTVHQIAYTIVWRSTHYRKRDRLLVDLRRQFADHALYHRSERPRAGVVEFAVRGQPRVRGARARV